MYGGGVEHPEDCWCPVCDPDRVRDMDIADYLENDCD